MMLKMPQRPTTLASSPGMLFAILLLGCQSSDPGASGLGGSTGTSPPGFGGTSVGGASGKGGGIQGNGGATQTNSGGSSQATPSGGNVDQGGASSNGGTTTSATSGGVGQGGVGQGGVAQGGVAQGGTVQGGVGQGGVAQGGVAQGGTVQGGTAVGGKAAGGAATGGVSSSAGGKATGGTATGGASMGGSATGGSALGGTTNSGGGTTATGSCAPPTTGHYQMEDLDRGVVAAKVTGGVYVGWRMMGYEYNPTSPTSISYNVYKAGTKLATVTDSTNYLDAAGTTSSTYTVSAVINGTECPQSPSVTTWAQNYANIPLQAPGSGYSANDASPGDLDGDGKLDIVLKWDPSDAQDNANAGVTSDVYIDGYTLAGTRLFRINLGPNIRAGAHYTQMSVYDFDGDGKAELAVKTAPGTKDGTGAYLSKGPAANDDDSQVYRNSDGYILTGPEYLTVFSGTNGAELATVAYPVARGTVSSWGDSYGNRVDRFNGGMAFVKDGGTATGRPSIIQQRGYYTRLTVSALTWRNGTLATNWTFDSNGTGNSKAAGGGDHSCMAADANNDGAQEIITGATTIASNGTFQCSSGKGHGDAMHVSELVVGKGISVFSVHEGGTYGHDCHDAATCSFYIDTPGSDDNGRGVADYVNASNTTAATCSSGVGSMNCSTGATVGSNAGSNFLIYWDADESRELENGTSITKDGGGTLLSASGCASNNGTKSTPTLTADLLGDWREEIVYRTSDNTALRVYTTTAVTTRRIYTLMHDPTYRAQVAFENSSYNQPPHVGFHIGAGMANPPKPDIYVK
jgi:rhamnogalacturonan endolyase